MYTKAKDHEEYRAALTEEFFEEASRHPDGVRACAKELIRTLHDDTSRFPFSDTMDVKFIAGYLATKQTRRSKKNATQHVQVGTIKYLKSGIRHIYAASNKLLEWEAFRVELAKVVKGAGRRDAAAKRDGTLGIGSGKAPLTHDIFKELCLAVLRNHTPSKSRDHFGAPVLHAYMVRTL